MPIKSDKWIRRMCEEHGMIEPFETGQVRKGNISYGSRRTGTTSACLVSSRSSRT